jgi:hypothetical protein
MKLTLTRYLMFDLLEVNKAYGHKGLPKLGSVAGPVIQVNGSLSFEDDLRSGGLLYCDKSDKNKQF